jgi:hypothetical protein
VSLTSELDQPARPIARHLRERFPLLRVVQGPYREATARLAPLLPPDGARIAYGTVGTAFDWRVRFLLDPQPDLHLGFLGAALMGRSWLKLAGELMAELGGRLHIGGEPAPRSSPRAGRPRVFFETHPGRAATADPERLARACYALALFTEVFRAGTKVGSRLNMVTATASLDGLLMLASADEVADLMALTEAARRNLLPAVAARGGPLHLGPTFAGSLDVGGADADVIVGGLLVEVKVQLGGRTRDGRRRCSLEQRTMHELLGYLLLDYDDAHQIDTLGVYSARWRYLATWPVDDLLCVLAGHPVDLVRERADFAALVKTTVAPRYSRSAPEGRAAQRRGGSIAPRPPAADPTVNI